MSEKITCPNCQASIEITEALSAQLQERLQKQFAEQQRQREREFAEREARLAEERKALLAAQAEQEAARQSLDEELQRRLAAERDKLQSAAMQKARQELSVELQDRQAELADTRSRLQKSQEQELELRKQTRELEERQREFELTMSRQLDQERTKIRETALREAEEQRQLKDAEKDKLISDMRAQITELQRKSEQGSQQLQGEVLELTLEELLRRQFPFDQILPVPKGIHGGDVLQQVHDSTGHQCGTILWESKRTKNWSDGWLPKLRDDQRAAKAQLAVLVSMELPRGVSTFSCHEGVWVTSFACALSLAQALRHGLIEVACARLATNGQHGKMELLYNYLAGPEFKLRIEGVVEAFVTLKEELEAEKRAMQRLWSKREKQLDRAVLQMSQMHGDLSGIIGKSLPEIQALALPAEPAPSEGNLFPDS